MNIWILFYLDISHETSYKHIYLRVWVCGCVCVVDIAWASIPQNFCKICISLKPIIIEKFFFFHKINCVGLINKNLFFEMFPKLTNFSEKNVLCCFTYILNSVILSVHIWIFYLPAPLIIIIKLWLFIECLSSFHSLR